MCVKDQACKQHCGTHTHTHILLRHNADVGLRRCPHTHTHTRSHTLICLTALHFVFLLRVQISTYPIPSQGVNACQIGGK